MPQLKTNVLGYLLLEKVEEAFRSHRLNNRGTAIHFFGKTRLFKAILRVGNEDLRRIWGALGPGDFLDVNSTCGGRFLTFYGGEEGGEDWTRMLEALMDFECRYCPGGAVWPILERGKPDPFPAEESRWLDA